MRTTEAVQREVSIQPIQILLVDDHPVLRSGVHTLLDSEHDLQVVAEAGDGGTAVRLALEIAPHVVIMDISLPQLGGTEATKQILVARPDLRILVLSAHEEIAFARMLLDVGAAGYALKRSACDELARAVRIVASGGTYVDPAIAGQLVSAQRRHNGGSLAIGSVPTVSLSEREMEVIRLVAQGHTSKEMANQLGLSPRTLETYKARAMSKLNLRSRADLIRYALRCGWLRDA